MDGLFSDEELFLTQNSFSEERVEDNFSIDSILDGLVACDEPVSQNSTPETSTKIEFSKAFDTSNEAVSLSGSIGSQKAPLKREVELEEETTRKFSKSCDEARIPETTAMTFNQCTFIISKDWKLN